MARQSHQTGSARQSWLRNIESMLLEAQMRWTGHVVRMEGSLIPRQVMYGELKEVQELPGN